LQLLRTLKSITLPQHCLATATRDDDASTCMLA
jgi:hypothetical protein